MQREDFPAFVALLSDVMGLYPQAKPLADGQTAMFFRALAAYPLQAVRAAMDAHVKDPARGRFPPLPADAIAQIEGQAENDGRPGAEEAWALSLQARDEAETVVWTAEMAQAWAIAKPVLDLGDDVGARMAFRESYARLVELARKQRMPASWSASLGMDPGRRASAITDAVKAGRLPQSELLALPAPSTGGLLALAMSAPSSAPPAARQALRDLAEKLRAAPDPESADVAERRRTKALKDDAAAKVAAYVAGAQA